LALCIAPAAAGILQLLIGIAWTGGALGGQNPITFSSLAWEQNGYVESISGELCKPFSVPVVTFSIYMRTGALPGNTVPVIVESVAPGQRWAFSAPILTSTYSPIPA
jgi:hypothetical protein